ncbi:alpha/beta fold hydrolase [Kitasatospora misakiensis]|uniref:Alpha/beta fold hydrolase n=1 Tax=Kitasatospora misakiensis TaxID=67330 RepID=A0ABW0XDJ3_9ACTN
MPQESIHTLRYAGFTYHCRVMAADRPAMDPVLILGGAFQDMFAWRRHEAVLTRSTTVITLDLPGWGGADHLPHDYDIDFLAEATARALGALGTARVNLLGCSYGALVAHRFAQRHPTLVRSLALQGLIDTPTPEEVTRLQRTAALLSAGEIRQFVASVVDSMSPSDPARPVRRGEAVRRVLASQLLGAPEGFRDKFISNSRRLWGTRVIHPDPSPPVPVVLFTGEHDTLAPLENASRVASTYPSSVCVAVAEADHLVHVQRDAEYCELLMAHFNGRRVTDLPFCRPYRRGQR